MTHILDFTYTPELTLTPETPEEETLQNLYCLLNTTIAEVPCYREYGIDKSFLHAPANVARTKLVAAVAEALNKYFPELTLVQVDFDYEGEAPDIMKCRIEVTDNEEL